MFDGNLALDGIDCDLRYKELQDPTFIFKGEAIKMLSNFFLEHGKMFHQP